MRLSPVAIPCLIAFALIGLQGQIASAQQNQVAVKLNDPAGGAVLLPNTKITMKGTALDPTTTSTYQIIGHIVNTTTGATVDSTAPLNVTIRKGVVTDVSVDITTPNGVQGNQLTLVLEVSTAVRGGKSDPPTKAKF